MNEAEFSFILTLAFSLPFLLVFGLMFLFSLLGLLRAISAVNWPATQGRIVTSHIQEKQKANRIKYKPVIEYLYYIHGREYKGSVISFGGRRPLRSMEEAERFIGPYRQGNTVEVFYNPLKPQQSCLNKSYEILPYLIMIIMSLAALTIVGRPLYMKVTRVL